MSSPSGPWTPTDPARAPLDVGAPSGAGPPSGAGARSHAGANANDGAGSNAGAAPDAGPFHNAGAPLRTAADAAAYLGAAHSQMLYTLYRAPDAARYRAFEIPKRSGGMRQISAPIGQLRVWQEKLAPAIAAAYAPHPNAHGVIGARSIVSNARVHTGQRLVLNIDLSDFFPTINFGRVRGLFMKPPFSLGPSAATIFAQICTHRNGLPQGAPTSPPLSNFIAATLDRRLTRLAREHNLRYSRYADDITFSTNRPVFPPSIAQVSQVEEAGKVALRVDAGDVLERAIEASGFTVNHAKVRMHNHHERQKVTGLTVNSAVNVQRVRIRRIRALLHAWEKYTIEGAARTHFLVHRGARAAPNNAERKFRNIVYGELAFVKMVRGRDDPVFLNLCAKLIKLDPNPSRFIRQMVFGADDYDVFISHASEDKDDVARPIFEACQRAGVKAFLDEAHIGWGQSFTTKINSALGAARTILAVVSNRSVAKDWPLAEVNTALALEVNGHKKVVPLLVGDPDLTRLPLIGAKDAMRWTGDADAVAARLKRALAGDAPRRPAAAGLRSGVGSTAAPITGAPDGASSRAAVGVRSGRRPAHGEPAPRRGLWDIVFGRRRR
jgi:RNA-directed DNA polymerase